MQQTKLVSAHRKTPLSQVYLSVVDNIQQSIRAGEWLPGQRLPSITELGARYAVGTGSVREAIRTLESRGILRMEHGRGTFVSSVENTRELSFDLLATDSILALCEARRVLEPELAALACDRGSDTEVAEIARLAREMEELIRRGADFVEPDIMFHRKIAAASHNEVLEHMMEGVNDLFLASRRRTMLQPGMNERAARFHLMIADAIQQRNAILARQRMLAHIHDLTNSLISTQTNSLQSYIEVIS